MKLRNLLNEIGNNLEIPPGINIATSEYSGQINFDATGLRYRIDIKIVAKNENKIGLLIYFGTDETQDAMANKYQALKIMSYIVGSIEFWIKKYKQKYSKNSPLYLTYIKYNPKSEIGIHGVESGVGNRRDRLYRAYIQKFATRFNSTVSFSAVGGIISIFNPPITFE